MNEWLAARNILAVRLDNIGDVIMLEPALRAVKETSPEARLTLLASPAGATAVPLLSSVITSLLTSHLSRLTCLRLRTAASTICPL